MTLARNYCLYSFHSQLHWKKKRFPCKKKKKKIQESAMFCECKFTRIMLRLICLYLHFISISIIFYAHDLRRTGVEIIKYII